MKRMNWNSLLLTIGFGLLAFIGKELYGEIRLTHDAVIRLQTQTVSRTEFDMQITDLRTRMALIDIEIQKLKIYTKN